MHACMHSCIHTYIPLHNIHTYIYTYIIYIYIYIYINKLDRVRLPLALCAPEAQLSTVLASARGRSGAVANGVRW